MASSPCGLGEGGQTAEERQPAAPGDADAARSPCLTPVAPSITFYDGAKMNAGHGAKLAKF